MDHLEELLFMGVSRFSMTRDLCWLSETTVSMYSAGGSGSPKSNTIEAEGVLLLFMFKPLNSRYHLRVVEPL